MALFLGSVSMRAAFYARKASCPVSVGTACGTKKSIGDNLSLDGGGFAPRTSCVLLVLCLLAGSSSVWLFETSSAVAKQRSTVVKKDKQSSILKKDKPVAARKKQKSFAAKNRKSIVSAREEARIISQVQTPVDKHEKDVAAAPEKTKTGPAIQMLRVKPDEDLSDVRANWLDDAPVDLIVGEDLWGMFGVGGQWVLPAYDAAGR